MHSGKIYIRGLSDDIKHDSAEDVSCCNVPSHRRAEQLLARLQSGRKPRCEASRDELMSDSRNYLLLRIYEDRTSAKNNPIRKSR